MAAQNINLFIVFGVYFVFARALMSSNAKLQFKYIGLAVLNIAALWFIGSWKQWWILYVLYLSFVFLQYLFLVLGGKLKYSKSWWPAIWFPILVLFVLKYRPDLLDSTWKILQRKPDGILALYFIGISFVCFRL